MATNDRFNFLIIDPDSASRGKLKQVALALTTFNKVYTVPTLSEGLQKSTGPDPVDVVALSYRYSIEEQQKFIDQAKQTKKGEDWAYMLVLKTQEQKNEIIANSVISGIDGFLFEPYSADNLREMAEIVAKVKLQNEMKRKKAAMVMLLKEISGHLDAVAFYKSKGREPVVASKKLYDSCANLKRFSGENFDLYVSTAIDIFEQAQPLAAASYSGVSKRVKDRLESKMLKELEDRYK